MRLKPAIVSIHDVMPETLALVEDIISRHLTHFKAENILLLVVPGLNWNDEQIERLKQLESKGYELAGHGWKHQVHQFGGFCHRLHSLTVSRRAAEHLSYSEAELVELLKKNYQWFKANELKQPTFYVPPAWAMGTLSRKAFKLLPFYGYETTAGIRRQPSGKFRALPLLGFEADTRFRAGFLRLWNRINLFRASSFRPVRLSIHPYDFEYLIADQLKAMLGSVSAVSWRSVFTDEVTIPAVYAEEAQAD